MFIRLRLGNKFIALEISKGIIYDDDFHCYRQHIDPHDEERHGGHGDPHGGHDPHGHEAGHRDPHHGSGHGGGTGHGH